MPLCEELSARIRAIWEAFCECASEWIAYFLNFVVSVPEADAPMVAQPPEAIEPGPIFRNKHGVVITHEMIDELARLCQGGGELFFTAKSRKREDHQRIRISPAWSRSNTVEQRFHHIPEQLHLRLHQVSNPSLTPEDGSRNCVKLLLNLEADPNDRAWYGQYTPLHCAVLTGSLAAYRTLREAGADPMLKNRVDDGSESQVEEDHPIGWAEKILASGSELHVYFIQTVFESNRVGLIVLFPSAYGKEREDQGDAHLQRVKKLCGTRVSIEAILTYEKGLVQPQIDRIKLALPDRLPPALLELIRGYLLGQKIDRK